MTTTDPISFDPALHANGETDALQVLDLVLYHQMGTSSALEIARVAGLLPSWVSHNVVALANARADDTRDWYFPVYTRKAIPTHTRDGATSSSRSWCGIHHWAENEASAAVHRLPPLPALPPSWQISTIVASAGGLLLLMPPIYPISSSESGDHETVRRHPCMACGNGGSRRHLQDCWMNSNDWGRTKTRLRYAESKVPQDWKPLLVCNPLTQTWRELPAAPGAAENSDGGSNSSKWRYDQVLVDMTVDEFDPANSYTIVMTFRSSSCMCIYTSTSNTWARHHSEPLITRGPGNRMTWKSNICANAVARGRLHYAFLEYVLDERSLATLRVFQIQVATGEWRPWREYALRVRMWRIMEARFFPYFQRQVAIAGPGRAASEALRYVALVECMGQMYAVIPTRLNEILTSTDNIININNNNNNHNVVLVRAWEAVHRSHEAEESSKVMPVHFHILGLNWDQNNKLDLHGLLRIQAPEDRTDLQLRTTSLWEKTSLGYFPFWNWFSCAARGSVIWVTCEDYLLQFDVISGQSKTQIIRKPRLVDAGVSYRPSFHMEP